MAMSLTTLPPELIRCVVANVDSQPTLHNLAQCSRLLYRCTIPYLYRHITIHEETLQEQQTGHLKNLASLLIRRPDLAGLVRHFALHVEKPLWMKAALSKEFGDYEDSEELEEPKESEDSEYSEEFEEPEESEARISSKLVKVDQASTTAINASSSSKEEKICSRPEKFSDIPKSNHDLILALLLPALLKVEKVVLDLGVSSRTNYLEQTIQRATRGDWPFGIQPPFEALTVFVDSHNAYNTRRTTFIASLLKLPAIQNISGGFAHSWEDEDELLIGLDSSSSPLTSLDLANYTLSAADLGRILRVPKALKNLSYKVCPSGGMLFTDLRRALAPHERCLESLLLDCDEGLDGESDLLDPMISFTSFNTLKVFKIAAVFLSMEAGFEHESLIDIFPPSLETLHLIRFQACFESLLQALEHLLAQKPLQQIPSLKTLILEESESIQEMCLTRHPKLMDLLWRRTQETAIGRLSRVAAARGVSIDVIEE